MTTRNSAAVDVLLNGLRTMLTVSFEPLADVVARLDTTGSVWILYIDSDSPCEDQCWAMADALRVLTLGVHSAESATSASGLRLVADPRPADRRPAQPTASPLLLPAQRTQPARAERRTLPAREARRSGW